MNRVVTGLSAVFLAAVLGAPAGAQQADRPPELTPCTGDYVCANDPSVVATWPLERWDSVRRRGMQASLTVPPASDLQQLARSFADSLALTTP